MANNYERGIKIILQLRSLLDTIASGPVAAEEWVGRYSAMLVRHNTSNDSNVKLTIIYSGIFGSAYAVHSQQGTR
jgi:hypothetical protein